MVEDEQLERCAQQCDAMVRELESQKPTARKGQYDRQTPRQIDRAIRAVRRVGERIRALKSMDAHEAHALDSNGDKLARAIALAKDVKPVIAKMRESAWKQEILRRLDELTG